MKYNLIHLYIGNGKGKTSAAYGLALRAIGNNMKVLIISFLKNKNSGEIKILEKIKTETGCPQILVSSHNHSFYFTLSDKEKEEVNCEVNDLYKAFEKAVNSEEFDLIVLDEIIDAVNLGIIDEEALLTLLKKRTSEVVITGRNPSDKLISLADYVSEIRKIKHPYDCGNSARQGIEF